MADIDKLHEELEEYKSLCKEYSEKMQEDM